MKNFVISFIAIIIILGLVGCSSNKDVEIINTFEPTPSNPPGLRRELAEYMKKLQCIINPDRQLSAFVW